MPKPKARVLKTCLDQFFVKELHWPATSPDFSLIEFLCDELQQRLQLRASCPTSLFNLINALQNAHKNTPQYYGNPSGVKAVMAVKGKPTPYSPCWCNNQVGPNTFIHLVWIITNQNLSNK